MIKLRLLAIRAIEWKARNGMNILRVSLGLVFLWFGFIKFFPKLSVAEAIASKTILALSDGMIPENVSMPILAVWECAIGIGLLTGRRLKYVLFLLYLQMFGTLTPLILFPHETWTATLFVPTLLGQYIIKNAVLISAGIVIGATSNGGVLVSNPFIATKAINLQKIYTRYKQRYHKDPER